MYRKSLLLISVAAIVVTVWVASLPVRSDNPYKINDELYSYFVKTNKAITTGNGGLLMLDTLEHRAKELNDVKCRCMAMSMRTMYYGLASDVTNMLKNHERVRKFVENTPYKQYIFDSWNRVINYYLSVQDYQRCLLELGRSQKEAYRLNNDYGVIYNHIRMAEVYQMLGNPTLWYLSLKKAYKEMETRKYYVQEFELNFKMAKYYSAVDSLEQAEFYIKKAMVKAPSSYRHRCISMLLYVRSLRNAPKEQVDSINAELDKYMGNFKYSQITDYQKAKYTYYSYVGDTANLMTLLRGMPDNATRSNMLQNIYKNRRQYDSAYYYLNKLYRVEKSDWTDNITEKLVQMSQYTDSVRTEFMAQQAQIAQLEDERRIMALKKKHADLVNKNKDLLIANREKEIATQKQRQTFLQAQAKTHREQLRKEKEYTHRAQEEARMRQNMVYVIGVLALFILVSAAYFITRIRIANKKLQHKSRDEKEARIIAEKARKVAEDAQLRAENADSLKSLFLQNMSHEIRTPLNAIVGFSEVITDPDSDLEEEEKKEFAGLISTNSDLLLTLVNDILDMSKLESKTYNISLSEVNLSHLCETVAISVQHRVPDGVKLNVDVPDEAVVISTDASRVQQVLTNFLTNACKYTSEGTITVGYKRLDTGVIELWVSDTGTGIPPEKAEEIFKRFSKLDDFKQGTGLGLNICALIADLLGGSVSLDTTYTGGSRFVFDHPEKVVLKEKDS